jgi:type I restriction enzyme S subunit
MISGKMYRFRVPNNLVDPRYVEAYLQTATAQTAINQMKTGGSDSGLNLTHARFRQLQVPVAPLREQRRIVEKIDRLVSKLDVGVLALKRVQTNLKRYRAAVLKDACLGRLVPTEAELARSEGRSYEPATQLMARVLQEHRVKSVSGQPVTNFSKADQVDTTGLPALPEGWAWTTINAFLREPLRNGHSARASRDGSGIRTLTLTAVTSDDFSEMNTKLTVAAPDDVADLWLTPGDILIERSNTPELVGTAALYRGRARYAIFPDLLIRVRLLSSISKEYVTYVLQSQHGREYFRRSAQGIAGTMPKVDQTTVERFPVPVPPLAEQQRIVKELEMRISIVRELGVLVAANIKRAKRLRQSILKRAFEGKLVPQDPSDEPASILLERIGAERQAAKPDRESRRQTREIRIGRRAGCTDG